MPGVRRDWVAEMEQLTAGGPEWPADAVAAAERDAGELIALARVLVEHGLVPATCGTPDGCALAGVEPRLCDLVRMLARLAPPTSASAPEHAEGGAAVAAFLEALADVGSAIYVCRRVLHATGGCLFPASAAAPDAPQDLCAELLLAAHRLGDAGSGVKDAHRS